MEISVKHDLDAVSRQLRHLSTDVLPKSAAYALNDVAFMARRALQDHLRNVLDSPTPYTVNRPFVAKATPRSLAALVSLEGRTRRYTAGGDFAGTFDAAAEARNYLMPHIVGGPRAEKGLERLLKKRGYLGPGEFLVPSKYQPLDSFGNVPRGVVQKILANLGAFRDPLQNTPRGGARAGKKKGEYFFTRAGVRGARLTAIWRRTAVGNATPAFVVVSGAPRYKRRILVFATVNRVFIEKWPAEFARQVGKQLRR